MNVQTQNSLDLSTRFGGLTGTLSSPLATIRCVHHALFEYVLGRHKMSQQGYLSVQHRGFSTLNNFNILIWLLILSLVNSM